MTKITETVRGDRFHIGSNGRIVIYKGRYGILIPFGLHYNHTCKGNQPMYRMKLPARHPF